MQQGQSPEAKVHKDEISQAGAGGDLVIQASPRPCPS